MARLESEGRGGFYPTPPEEMQLILKRLTCDQGDKISLLDPCAGKGAALADWKTHMQSLGAQATNYGIEIEKSRAGIAEKHVDHLLKCGYEETRISHDAFSAIYLNPPFMQIKSERAEVTFLKDLTQDYLQPGGVLIFNIPQYVLRDAAKILASRFNNIRVYRFTDENYDTYKQVIVYAVRRRRGLRSGEERIYQQKIEKELYNRSFLGKDAFPTLDSNDYSEIEYKIPSQQKEVELFQSTIVEIEDIIKSEEQSIFNFKVEQKISDLILTSEQKQIRPALPLKYTHMATAIASGVLPETMGTHLLVGVTKRVTEKKEQLNPKNGKTQEVTTSKPKSIVRVFSDKGIFNLK
ncbi:DUF6094 domain-containing protein [Cytobacillus sp. IB215665]|uniref:DUF6094 domain-containing protein n=1 Tax=Cytobacillus sp. IB215665 TaxID=3097357 RepID=UPI002A1422B2|nr:DUF6094 domain-containing protein [Cytobacillus sp. IB215665]MDX8367700.1 DUF6094 domain-containing protein [Cytobacillus sp. IB215665]